MWANKSIRAEKLADLERRQGVVMPVRAEQQLKARHEHRVWGDHRLGTGAKDSKAGLRTVNTAGQSSSQCKSVVWR